MKYLKDRLYNEELLDDNSFKIYSKEIMHDLFCLLFYKDKNIILNKVQEDFLLFLYDKKSKNENLKDGFLYFFLWIGSYHEIIIKLLEIIAKFSKYFIEDENKNNNFLEHIKVAYDKIESSLFLDKQEKKDKDKDNQEEEMKEKVNGIFYRISEVICLVITNEINFKEIDNLELLFTDFNETAQAFSQLNIILSLSLRRYYSLISIAKLIEYYIKNSKDIKINKKDFKLRLNSFIKNIDEENDFITNKDNKEDYNIIKAKEAFIEQLKIVMEFSNELSMKIFVNKYLQYSKYEKYKIELVKILFDYPKLIQYSFLFFNYIFLTQPIKPKKQIKKLKENEKEEYIQKFGEIRNKYKDKILTEINKKAENNEILKEILIYIFELRINTYFEDCQKIKFMQKSPEEILLGLNFEYFKRSNNIINSQEFGKLKTIGMIFYFSYIRCYLNYFVKLQIENNKLGDLSEIHKYLIDKSKLGLLVILYIAQLFIIYNKRQYFFEEYLKDEKMNNWKQLIISQNNKVELFPTLNYENSKHLLFVIWAKINNNNLSQDFIKNLTIRDLSYLINFSYNEMSLKEKDGNLEESKLLIKLNELKNNFSFKKNEKEKIKILLKNISSIEFFKNINIELKLIFIMINLYIIGFSSSQNNELYSLMYSDNIIYLIKILLNKNNLDFNIDNIKDYYQIKKIFEKNYIEEKKYFPVYVCSCKRWYYIENDERKNCECGLKIEMNKTIKNQRNNNYVIYYDKQQQKSLENERQNKNIAKSTITIKSLKDLKNEIIEQPLLKVGHKLESLLLNNEEINVFKIFINFIFLCQIFIEYKIGIINENEIINEFGNIDFINEINNLNEEIKNYCDKKNINYYYFINYFCDSYITFLQSNDFVKVKEKIYTFIKKRIGNFKNYNDQSFYNIETNILTTSTYDPEFKNENLKYLLTVTKYPDIKELQNYINKYNKKHLPVLNTFVSIEKNTEKINKLSYIESINNFINSFAEENWNLITRHKIEEETIESYLIKNREKTNNLDNSLNLQFEKFCEAYNEINEEANIKPTTINKYKPIITILNDKNKNSSINQLYSFLIKTQNEFLLKVIEEYNKMDENQKKDIIIKNAIEEIKKEIPIQQATQNDIFSFNVKNNIILCFEELFSFYSSKNIFNKKDDTIDYTNYSSIKFKLSMIEKELINIILSGKKLFSKKQIYYKFYLDPFDVEEKTKNFERFTEIYEFEKINNEEKTILKTQTNDINMKKMILPNLEILINYLIKENKYQGRQSVSEIKFHSNLYLNQNFIHLFKNFKSFTINKLISMYEFLEELLWDFIANRYIINDFKEVGFVNKYKNKINSFIQNENKRELKNDMIISLLIKFICRYLPNADREIQERDLFGMILEKNNNLPQQIQNELINIKNDLEVEVKYAIDLTDYLVRIINNKNKELMQEKKEEKQNQDEKNDKEEEEEEIINDDDEDERDL